MVRKIFAVSALALGVNQANAALVGGDIMFTSFNADEDGFSLVTFVNLGANSTIYFTDNEWNGSAIGSGGAFNTGESYSQWNTGGGQIDAGTVVRFNNVDSATLLGASKGTFGRVTVSGSSNWGISNANETLYAYLGSSATAPSTFLSAITNGNFAVDGPIVNTGLVQGITAVDLNGNLTTSPDYGVYQGPRTGLSNFADYKVLVANEANWTVDAMNGTYAATVPSTTAFTAVNNVPVPASAWLLGSALVGIAGLRRRKV